MTKIWGPLGWATLHSVAALYPDEPTQLEQQLLVRWIDAFRRTIVCEKCHNHFTQLFNQYSSTYPRWNASRRDFTLFILRAHNTVNLRNGQTVFTQKESFEHLRRNVDPAKAHLQRQSYLLYIQRDWSKQTTLAGATAARHVRELITTETDYWSKQDPFTWDEIEGMVQGEHVDPLASVLPKRTTILGDVTRRIMRAPRTTPVISAAPTPPQPHRITQPSRPSISVTVPTSKPRFSFVSR
jgi:hypothetical protein